MDAPKKTVEPQIKHIAIPFELKRNQVIDLMKALKLIVRDYDNASIPGRYVVGRIMANDKYIVEIGLDRAKDENHPLCKSLRKDIDAAKQKAQDGKNLQEMPKQGQG